MTLDLLCQILIGICGASAVWLVAQTKRWRKWGYLVGLAAQPCWIYTTIIHEQYLITGVTLWYAYSWWSGVNNFIIKGKLK